MKTGFFPISLCFIKIENNALILEGTYDEKLVASLKMQCSTDVFLNLREDLKKFPANRKPFRFLVNLNVRGVGSGTKRQSPSRLADAPKISMDLVFFDNLNCNLPFCFGKFSPIQSRYRHSYYWKDGFAVTYDDNILYIRFFERRAPLERALLCEILSEHSVRGLKNFILRIAKKYLPQVSKNVWLISDRINRANDNGEALFRYVNKNKVTRSYFALAKESPDYKRLKKYGKVIPFGKLRYKLLYLTGAVIVSSQGEDVVYRPLRENTAVLSDLIQDTKFVFLQHGVIKDDMSDWLNRYNKNITMFVCTTRPEYESIMNGAYDYDSRQVKLVGLPRHDRLVGNLGTAFDSHSSAAPEKLSEKKKLISVIFTWRNSLVELPDKNGFRKLKPDFTDSSYYQTLKTLMLDENLQEFLTARNCRMQFILHPSMESALAEFRKLHSVWDVFMADDYTKIFQETSLLVTDYSSVAFDFAMLRRPVLYCQADKEEFFSGQHMYQAGYFDYERDGFGEVTTTAKECAVRICSYVESDFRLFELYEERIRDTFPFGNEGNCRRTCSAIQKMLESSKRPG